MAEESTIETPIPVVSAANVPSTCVPVVLAVELRSMRTPAVVPVSIEVEVTRSKELPAPRTEVVCEINMAVEVPATIALFTILTVSPAVVLTPVTPSALPVPVVEAPVILTSDPVNPVVTPDWVTLRADAEVCDAPLETMESPMPVVRAEAVRRAAVPVVAADARSSSVPVVVPVSTEVELIRSSEFPAPSTDVVWLMSIAVLVPATRALLMTLTVSPVVVFTPVTWSVFPAPVVEDPVKLTTDPVNPVVVPD